MNEQRLIIIERDSQGNVENTVDMPVSRGYKDFYYGGVLGRTLTHILISDDEDEINRARQEMNE